jgi:hypothetical protein
MARRRRQKLVFGKDYVYENGHCVLTRQYLLSLGECCNNNCPHCPYKPGQSSDTTGSSSKLLALTSRTAH